MSVPFLPPGVRNLIGDLQERGIATQRDLALVTHKDTYALVRDVATQTGYGTDTMVSTIVETGMCALDVRQVNTVEAGRAEALTASTDYVVSLPAASIVRPSDRLIVNGRDVEITGVQRGGHFAPFTVVNVQEQS